MSRTARARQVSIFRYLRSPLSHARSSLFAISNTVLVIVACTTMLACTPARFDHTEELDTILTIREPGRDFSGFESFAMPEEVLDLSSLVDDPIEIDDRFDPTILDRLAENMANYGYTRIADPLSGEADVVLIPGVVATNNWVLLGFYPWYDYWWGYPPVAIPVNYPAGSIIVTMINLNERREEDGRKIVPVIWAAGIRGLLESSDRNTRRRIEETIDQAFLQSPYLEVGDPVDPQLGLQPDGSNNDDGGVQDGAMQ